MTLCVEDYFFRIQPTSQPSGRSGQQVFLTNISVLHSGQAVQVGNEQKGLVLWVFAHFYRRTDCAQDVS